MPLYILPCSYDSCKITLYMSLTIYTLKIAEENNRNM